MPSRSPRDLQNDIQRAVTILEYFTNPNHGRDVKMLIPPSVLANAHGIVFIRLYRIGFMVSAKSGTGVIIARLPDGSWSAPSGVSISSLGFGHQAGGEVIDSIIVMNYRAAVKAFYDGGGQLQLGVGASLAAGPYGRAADVSASASSTTHIAATYAYSASKGLYAGYSFEGSRISERPNTNLAYYGRPITAREILTGYVPPPQDAARLYNMLLSLGAGPRPGLPFAPQKSQQLPPHMATSPYQQQQPQSPTQQQPPYQQQQQQRPANDEPYNDPPPPYQAYDASKPLPQQSNNNSFYNSSNEKQQPNNLGRTSSQYSQNSAVAVQNTNYPNEKQQPNNLGRTSSQYSRESVHNAAIAGPSHTPFNQAYSIPPEQKTNNGYSTDTKQPFSDTKQPPPAQDVMTVVVAKYDFTANESSDLSFKAGDTIIVTKRLGNRESWWEGEIGDKRGFFPANYTEDLTE